MKQVKMFMLKSCPHCQRAIKMVDELIAENNIFSAIEIEMIDEQVHADIADKYDYYYVPTYYVGGEKVHEGVPTKEKLLHVLELCVAKE